MIGEYRLIRIHSMQDGITELGPGIRFGLWTQGCRRKCPGCMIPDSWPLDGGYLVEIDDLVKIILESGRTELTISGGEPFMQAGALAQMIEKIRRARDIGVIVYTGFTYSEIVNMLDEGFQALLKQCDLIIDGAYIESLNDGKKFRGSSNQRVILLTDRYREFVEQEL